MIYLNTYFLHHMTRVFMNTKCLYLTKKINHILPIQLVMILIIFYVLRSQLNMIHYCGIYIQAMKIYHILIC